MYTVYVGLSICRWLWMVRQKRETRDRRCSRPIFAIGAAVTVGELIGWLINGSSCLVALMFFFASIPWFLGSLADGQCYGRLGDAAGGVSELCWHEAGTTRFVMLYRVSVLGSLDMVPPLLGWRSQLASSWWTPEPCNESHHFFREKAPHWRNTLWTSQLNLQAVRAELMKEKGGLAQAVWLPAVTEKIQQLKFDHWAIPSNSAAWGIWPTRCGGEYHP